MEGLHSRSHRLLARDISLQLWDQVSGILLAGAWRLPVAPCQVGILKQVAQFVKPARRICGSVHQHGVFCNITQSRRHVPSLLSFLLVRSSSQACSHSWGGFQEVGVIRGHGFY